MDGSPTTVEIRSTSGTSYKVEDVDITTTTVSMFTERFLSITGADSSSLRNLRTKNGKLDDPSAPLAAHIGPTSPVIYAILALGVGPNLSHIVPGGVSPPPNACLGGNQASGNDDGNDDGDDDGNDDGRYDGGDGDPPSPLVHYRIVVPSHVAGYFPDVDSLGRMTQCVLRVVGYGKSFVGGEGGEIVLEVETTDVPVDLVELDSGHGVHLAMDVEFNVPESARWVWGPNREYEVKVEMYGKERGGVWRFSTRREGDQGIHGSVTAPELGVFHFEAKTAGSGGGEEGIPLPCDQLFRAQNAFAQWEDGNTAAFKVLVNGVVCPNEALSFERVGDAEFYVRIVDDRVLGELEANGSVACLVVDKQSFHFASGSVLAGNVYGVWRTEGGL